MEINSLQRTKKERMDAFLMENGNAVGNICMAGWLRGWMGGCVFRNEKIIMIPPL